MNNVQRKKHFSEDVFSSCLINIKIWISWNSVLKREVSIGFPESINLSFTVSFVFYLVRLVTTFHNLIQISFNISSGLSYFSLRFFLLSCSSANHLGTFQKSFIVWKVFQKKMSERILLTKKNKLSLLQFYSHVIILLLFF